MQEIKVAVITGSKSDVEVIEKCFDILKEFNVVYESKILSAHRSPELLEKYILDVQSRGCQIFIAGAGYAAHLAGVIASKTILPVIGIPIDSSSLKGMDSLLSTVQMPGGIPVATVSIGKAGAKNAALFAIQILSLNDDDLKNQMEEYRENMIKEIKEGNE